MRPFLLAAAGALLAGCGYIAGPLPPLANVPAKVTDLDAVQRGANLVVQCAIPRMTTEGRQMSEPPKLDLRIGPGPSPFTPDRWAAQAKVIPEGATKAGRALYEVPGGEWIGRDVLIGIRAIGANGKEDGWSFLSLPVVAPPQKPADIHGEPVLSEPGSAGLHLTWKASGKQFRVSRAVADSDRYDTIATVTEPAWTDSHLAFGTRYRYLVQTLEPLGEKLNPAESDLSEPFAITIEPPPPPAPGGLRAVAAPNSIELAWDAISEIEVAGYRIYRAAADGSLAKVAETGAVPTYSDRNVEHGKTYRYAVTAFDAAGKESAQSAAIEIALP
jgi:hypothetical protein